VHGFKTATSEEPPDAVAVMDPFHVVRRAGDALDQCRRRVQQVTCGHRGRKGDPLYAARRTLHTGAALLTDKQRQRLTALFADDEHVEVEATWGIHQRMIAAYREPDKKHGKAMMQAVIDSVASGVPDTLTEIRKLGRTLEQRATDILALFRPARHVERPHRGHQRRARAPPRQRPRIPEPDEPHRTLVARSRRIQTPTTPSIAMSLESLLAA
jgi:transposase